MSELDQDIRRRLARMLRRQAAQLMREAEALEREAPQSAEAEQRRKAKLRAEVVARLERQGAFECRDLRKIIGG